MNNVVFIVWQDSYSVGIKLMDEQHQFLIHLINELYGESQAHTAEKNVSNILDQMIRYSRFHFSAEEIMLKNAKYPNLDNQIKEHREYVARVLDFQSQMLVNQEIISLEVLHFLKEWWIGHIQGHDQLYRQFFLEKGLLTVE